VLSLSKQQVYLNACVQGINKEKKKRRNYI